MMINNKDELAFEFVKALWDSLDFTNIKGKRMMGIWDEFIAKLPQGIKKVYPDSKHEIFNADDDTLEKFYSDILDFWAWTWKWNSSSEKCDIKNHLFC